MTQGLTESEAAARRAARGAAPEPPASRSTAAIVRANTITPFNAILLALGILTLLFGDWRDALFLGILVANTGIGIWQELRAREKLDRLAALVTPRATVVRDGEARPVHSRTSSRETSCDSHPAIRSSPTARSSTRPGFGSTSRS